MNGPYESNMADIAVQGEVTPSTVLPTAPKETWSDSPKTQAQALPPTTKETSSEHKQTSAVVSSAPKETQNSCPPTSAVLPSAPKDTAAASPLAQKDTEAISPSSPKEAQKDSKPISTSVILPKAPEHLQLPKSEPTTAQNTAPVSVPNTATTTVPNTVATSVPNKATTAVPTSVLNTAPTSVPSSVPASVPSSVPTSVPSTAPTVLSAGSTPTPVVSPVEAWNDMSVKPKRKHAAMTAEVVPIPSSVAAAAAAVVAEASQSGDQNQPEKKARKDEPSTSKEDNRSPEEISKQLESTFDIRRNFITIEMPGIPIILDTYPDLFTGKNMLMEFQRISKIDIDHTIQEYCVKFAPGIVELAKHTSGSSNILKQSEQAKQDNAALKQYWDMVTALCLIPLLLKENIVEMVREIGEEDEVDPRGKVVPILIARGNIFKSDEFFLVAEETILQEFEEFTMAFATLFSSYWVFNMQYPRTLNNTYNFVQKAILHLRDETPIPPPCKQLVQKLQKWNKMGKVKK